jgi:arylsulfatase A-like enzyme
MPELSRLQKEGTYYSHAVAPSHWTVPSHASILTGREPWEHGTFRGSRLTLPPEIETYAELFRKSGYRTACFSANPFISPLTGLSRGYELAEWGQFSDCFRRFQSHPRPVGRTDASVINPSQPDGWIDRGFPPSLRDSARRLSTRFPLPWEVVIQARRLSRAREGARPSPVVSAWIESELTHFLSATTSDIPAFITINLLDAHEPYFGVLSDDRGTDPDWLWAFSGPLDRSGWRAGRTSPTSRDVARVTRLYKAAAETLDRRLKSILTTYGMLRDVSKADLIVLGDHGQALGEQGHMYHVRGSYASTLQVPLIVRAAGGPGHERVDSWVSATESFRLLANESETVSAVLSSAGREQRGDRHAPPFESVAALVDAPPEPSEPGSIRRNGDSVGAMGQAIVVYFQDRRFVLDVASGKTTVNSAVSDSAGDPVTTAGTGEGAAVLESARTILEQVRRCLMQGGSALGEKRLASWGY